MGRLEAFQIEGLDLWFNSSDHLGPHFHVGRISHWEYRVFFMEDPSEMFEKKYGKREMTTKERKLIEGAAAGHRLQLLREWERKVRVTAPGPEK